MNPAFLHEIQRLVVAQIANHFDTVKSSAADALAEVLASYIKEIGRAAHDSADVAGRTEVNIGDVLHALDAVGTNFQHLVKNAEQFEVPFAHALPLRLQIKRLPKRAPAFREVNEVAPVHIPKFLPALPDAHTLRHTDGEIAVVKKPSNNGKAVESSEDVLHSLKQSAALEKKRKFGEFEDNPSLGETNLQTKKAYGKTVGSARGRGDKDTDAAPGTNNTDSVVSLGLASTAGKHDSDGSKKIKQEGTFREQSNLSNADYDTVARLIHGQMSVFEAS